MLIKIQGRLENSTRNANKEPRGVILRTGTRFENYLVSGRAAENGMERRKILGPEEAPRVAGKESPGTAHRGEDSFDACLVRCHRSANGLVFVWYWFHVNSAAVLSFARILVLM